MPRSSTGNVHHSSRHVGLIFQTLTNAPLWGKPLRAPARKSPLANRMAAVHARLTELGVKDAERVNACLKAAVLNGHISLEGDGAGFYPRVGEHDYLLYLKRSFVTKSDGVYTGTGRRYNRHYYPMAYSVADSYFHAELMGKVQRTIDVLCSNRPTSKPVSYTHLTLPTKA